MFSDLDSIMKMCLIFFIFLFFTYPACASSVLLYTKKKTTSQSAWPGGIHACDCQPLNLQWVIHERQAEISQKGALCSCPHLFIAFTPKAFLSFHCDLCSRVACDMTLLLV